MKILIIDGPSGAGKTTLYTIFKKDFFTKFTGIKTYTDRSIRNSDVKDNDLIHLSRNKYEIIKKKKSLFEFEFEGSNYGFCLNDLSKELESKNVILILKNQVLKENLIKLFKHNKIILIYMYADSHIIKERLSNFDDSSNRLDRKQNSWEEFLNINHVQSEIIINNSSIPDLGKQINIIQKKYQL